MRFGPVSAISRARHFRRIERSEAVEFMTTEHLAVEFCCCIQLGHC
jgi:hypothetical protein